MKKAVTLAVMGLLCFSWISSNGTVARSTQRSDPSATRPAAEPEAAERIKQSGAEDRKLLIVYEKEQSHLRAEVIRRRDLYRAGQISKAEVLKAEQSLIGALARVHEVRRSILQRDMALTGATENHEPSRVIWPGSNGRVQPNPAARSSGGRWSLANATNIERFYSRTFGRSLPVTAYGQTATHKRLQFDHRNSMDVALHPDSPEGRALINHLRRTGIPHIAFRERIPGASTGAHIHIGHPSQRAGTH